MKKMQSLLILTAMLGATVSVHAASHAGAPMARAEAPEDSAMADGEIRKIDKGAKKITIRHGEIKNLDMPGMTMVFQVSDPALLDKVKPGDKVRFRAEKTGSAIVVTDIQPVR